MHTIKPDTIKSYAYTNGELITGKIRGLVLDLHGLGGGGMIGEHGDHHRRYAEHGVLFVSPYDNPWSWMNKTAVDTVDAIVDALFEKYSLDESTPIISTGGSMGGLSALVYSRYAKRTPVACAANCPVCDLVYHHTERDDLPRTVYSAFSSYDCSYEDAVKSASPMHITAEMPRIPYLIMHCDSDKLVNIDMHSTAFVNKMKALGHDIEYVIIPGRDHCDLSPEGGARYGEFILSFMK